MVVLCTQCEQMEWKKKQHIQAKGACLGPRAQMATMFRTFFKKSRKRPFIPGPCFSIATYQCHLLLRIVFIVLHLAGVVNCHWLYSHSNFFLVT